jgi:hypothetical protein
MANTFELIASSTVGSGGTATVTFTSIPGTFTDLCLKVSFRDSSANDRRILFVRFNGGTSGYVDRSIRGYNGGVLSQTDNGGNNSIAVWDVPAANATASTFSNVEIYIPNYAGTTAKSVSADGVGENNNANGAIAGLTAGSSTLASAITSIDLFNATGNIVEHSTAYLYGVKNA